MWSVTINKGPGSCDNVQTERAIFEYVLVVTVDFVVAVDGSRNLYFKFGQNRVSNS